jgi:hypothetical protein
VGVGGTLAWRRLYVSRMEEAVAAVVGVAICWRHLLGNYIRRLGKPFCNLTDNSEFSSLLHIDLNGLEC